MRFEKVTVVQAPATRSPTTVEDKHARALPLTSGPRPRTSSFPHPDPSVSPQREVAFGIQSEAKLLADSKGATECRARLRAQHPKSVRPQASRRLRARPAFDLSLSSRLGLGLSTSGLKPGPLKLTLGGCQFQLHQLLYCIRAESRVEQELLCLRRIFPKSEPPHALAHPNQRLSLQTSKTLVAGEVPHLRIFMLQMRQTSPTVDQAAPLGSPSRPVCENVMSLMFFFPVFNKLGSLSTANPSFPLGLSQAFFYRKGTGSFLGVGQGDASSDSTLVVLRRERACRWPAPPHFP